MNFVTNESGPMFSGERITASSFIQMSFHEEKPPSNSKCIDLSKVLMEAFAYVQRNMIA